MSFFFFTDTATTEIYTLSLHDALPICRCISFRSSVVVLTRFAAPSAADATAPGNSAEKPGPTRMARSEEHTSELQSRRDLVCRLLLEKKKTKNKKKNNTNL